MNKKRLFDFVVALILIAILLPPILLISALIIFSSKGPVLFWSNRVGLQNQIFQMPKFRTMQVNAPVVATHLLADSSKYLTPVGSFLRKSSLDEIPQLWCVLVGSMSLVGPRPALFNQYDLIELRTRHGVDRLVPGLTGWAQINGRDELSISSKVQYDVEYIQNQSFWFDIKIIGLTFLRVIGQSGIVH